MLAQSNKARWLGLLAWVAVSFLPALTAVFVETGSWYASLEKPAWTPPSWVFAPVWSTLYLLMGIAAWRIWDRFGFAQARAELVLYLVHLAFNAAWTWLFFGQRLIDVAAVEIIVLWMMILALTVLFWRRDRVAGMLLLPYLLWVTYASTLNIGIALMN
jgi:tryptophan-rich sensory protein